MVKSKRNTVKEKMEKMVRKPIRPLERQRMRPWLIDILDKGVVAQLSWLNKREKLFRITWRHAARQGWDMDKDACLFEKWARHTGKFYDGDKPDAKKWKANFRCALNSLPDVVEDKKKGMRKGQNAFKVYRFLDDRRAKSKKKCKEYSDDSDDVDYAAPSITNPRMDFDFDSEGSETGLSPRRDDSPCSDSDTSSSEASSPLPDFSKICKFEETGIPESQYNFIWQDASTPEMTTMSTSEDDESSTSSVPTDDEVVQMLLEDDTEYSPSSYWNTQCILPNQDSVTNEQCDVVVSYIVLDGNSSYPDQNPNVIVQPTQDVSDYNFTSLTEL